MKSLRILSQSEHEELVDKHNKGWSFKALANYFGISKKTAWLYYQREVESEVPNDKDSNDLQVQGDSRRGDSALSNTHSSLPTLQQAANA